LIGWGVDAVSGGQWKLLPEMVDVTLAPGGPSEPPMAIKEPKEKNTNS